MSIPSLRDFRGGYAVDVPYALLQPNELLKAENCYWKNDGLRGRMGWQEYSTDSWSGAIQGQHRVYLNSDYRNIIAFDDGTDCKIKVGETSYATNVKDANDTESDYTLTSGYAVSFAQLGDIVTATNGQDATIVIYWDSPNYVAMTLDQYDTRTRTEYDWDFGRYTSSTYQDPFVFDYEQDSAPGSPADGDLWYDTDDEVVKEYDDGTSTWSTVSIGEYQLATETDNEGCYIVSDYLFNKVEFSDLTDFSSISNTPVATFEYWNGSSWITITPTTEPTWDGEDTEVEFDIPHVGDTVSWGWYGTEESNLTNKYVLRIRFTTAPDGASFGCGTLTLKHTQYFSQIVGWNYPHLAYMHDNRMFYASGRNIHISMYNSWFNWRADFMEVFEGGSEDIMALVSYNRYLLIFKDAMLWGLTGNSYQNWQKLPLASIGTIATESVVNCNSVVAFLSRDGIYIWDNQQAFCISNHILSDIKFFRTDRATACFYNGYYHLSFPYTDIDDYLYPGDSSYPGIGDIVSGEDSATTPANYYLGGDSAGSLTESILLFDPDTIRKTDFGEGRVSFFKFTGYRVDGFIPCTESGDTGYLLGVNNHLPAVTWLYHSYTDNGEDIDFRVKTNYLELEGGVFRHFGRVKPEVNRSGEYTIFIRTDPETGEFDPDYYFDYYQETIPSSGLSHNDYWYNPGDRRIYQYDAPSSRWNVVRENVWGIHVFDSGSGQGYYTEDISVPYPCDGKKISFELRHLGGYAHMHALHFDESKRRF